VQTPAAFEYERATSVEGAIASLQRLGPEARVIAGGHSLLPMMKLRLANPEHLIDINDLTELAYIRAQDDEIAIGALTRHVELLKSELLAEHFPVFRDAETVIADPVVRNRGTIGGSLCQADAAEDLSAVCSAVKATVVIRGADGQRVVAMEDFHVGPYVTAVGDGELLTEIRIPKYTGWGGHYEKFVRVAHQWPIVAVAAAVRTEGGTISEARVGLTNMGSTPLRARAVEAALAGQPATDEAVRAAAASAAEGTNPPSDLNGDADYRKHLATVLTRRAVLAAAGG